MAHEDAGGEEILQVEGAGGTGAQQDHASIRLPRRSVRHGGASVAQAGRVDRVPGLGATQGDRAIGGRINDDLALQTRCGQRLWSGVRESGQCLAVEFSGQDQLRTGSSGLRDVARLVVVQRRQDLAGAMRESRHDGGSRKKRVDHHHDLVGQPLRINILLAQNDVHLAVRHLRTTP